MRLLLSFISILLISFSVCGFAKEATVPQIELLDETGVALEQVSGLTRFDNLLLFVAQKQHRLYYTDTESAMRLFTQSNASLRLSHIELEGAFPKEASWEAVAIARQGKVHHIYLSYEHIDEVDSFHKIFRGKIAREEEGLQVSFMTAFSQALAVNSNPNIKPEDRTNFGYESMIWDDKSERLLLMSELDGAPALWLDDKGVPQAMVTNKHGMRLSDMTGSDDNSCQILVSFCYKFDPVCEKRNGESKLTLAKASIVDSQFAIDDSIDISARYLDIETKDATQTGVYNAEGITFYQGQLLMVNDNIPGKGVTTALRQMALPEDWSGICGTPESSVSPLKVSSFPLKPVN